MRLVSTKSAKIGSVLGKSIYNDKGKILLNKGVKLDGRMLSRLQKMGITYIYVMDERMKDIVYKSTLPEKLRREAILTIEDTFRQSANDQNLDKSFVIDKASKNFSKLISTLLDEIKGDQNLISIMSDVYTYDHYIFSHSLNVTLYSLAIGLQLNFSQKDLELLGMGAILHDVGKMQIPENILLKPGRLTEEEFLQIKKHAEAGFDLLRGVHSVSLIVAHCAYQHHERLNGSGYPRGISGEDIHPFAKIIAVADVFDAVTSNRIYRQAMLPHEGMEILYAGSDTLFDAKLIESFRQSVALYPVGMTVELNDGRKGVVIHQNVGLCDRPIVRILEESGLRVKAYELDLKQDLSIMISGCDTTWQN
ncbi:HD-GYP domain-containing protein [Bacillus mesophilum]|uniref:HD-GYP domain-containing protein n=1 Tax=Bacillus mesophilum TaxID=1071718 RepID=A0A7V7RLX7_9BACI|nr:HD-GYP domain-containing protein [Bacillus mesophilum]KAB2332891.1 HD-GYP domain-containing protein [Bacillus mesophilum]